MLENKELLHFGDTYPLNQPNSGVVKQNSNAIVLSETIFRQKPLVYRNLSHLGCDVSTVPDNLRTDFDKFHEEAAK